MFRKCFGQMQMKTNYHTHTKRCQHAGGSEEDYVQAAIEAGVSVLGFSDHAPFPDKDYGYRMPYSELPVYFEAVDRVASAQGSPIIFKGLEIEYMPQYTDYYEMLHTKYKVDYLLLGEHFFLDETGTFLNITNASDTDEYVSYARAAAEGMRSGYFDVLAHPDIFAMNRFAWDENCDKAEDILLDAAVQTHTIFEFNANGFRRGIHDYPDGRRYMYPVDRFWRKIQGTGITVIIGSDCHEPDQVWDSCMERSLQMLGEFGISPIETLPKKRQ